MLRFFFIIISFFQFNCADTERNLKNKPIAITLKNGESMLIVIDSDSIQLTTFFQNRPPFSKKVRLSETLQKQINHKLGKVDWEINEIGCNYFINDKCLISPKIYDTLILNFKMGKTTFILDSSCDKYNKSGIFNPKPIRGLVLYLYAILDGIPEFENFPISDILYI
jgi:hypothetical protein